MVRRALRCFKCCQVALAWCLASETQHWLCSRLRCCSTWRAMTEQHRMLFLQYLSSTGGIIVPLRLSVPTTLLRRAVPPSWGRGLGLESTQIPHFLILFSLFRWYRMLPTVELWFDAWVYPRRLLKACKCYWTPCVRRSNLMLRKKKSIIEPAHS